MTIAATLYMLLAGQWTVIDQRPDMGACMAERADYVAAEINQHAEEHVYKCEDAR